MRCVCVWLVSAMAFYKAQPVIEFLTIARMQGDLMHAVCVCVCVASVGDGVLQGSACH